MADLWLSLGGEAQYSVGGRAGHVEAKLFKNNVGVDAVSPPVLYRVRAYDFCFLHANVLSDNVFWEALF